MKHQDPLQRIYALKVTIVAILALVSGVLLLALARNIAEAPGWNWLSFWPLGEFGGILVGAGLLGIVWDYFDGKDKEARDDARVRRLLKEAAPDFRDAVVRGFAVEPDDLKRVATPELLDQVVSNALGLRLGDATFAREIYADLVENVIRAPERWHDVDVRVRLSSIDARSTEGAPRFAVTVTWEYSVVPSSTIQKFACTSNRDEFHELVSDVPSASTWFMTPRPGFDAADGESFELLQYSVDGEEHAIRRSARKSGQTYSVKLDEDIVREGRIVRVRHVYRTITPKHGHLLLLAIAQPTHGLTLTLDYTETDIASMRVSDLISSSQRPRLTRLPEKTAAQEITMEVPGWLLPQAEVTFVWTLSGEVPQSGAEAESPALAA